MRKSLFILLGGAMLINYGCYKENTGQKAGPEIEAENKLLPAILQQLRSAPDPETRKMLYQNLGPAGKYALWQSHFSYWKDSAAIKKNRPKFSLVAELGAYLSLAIFTDGSREKDVFLNYTWPLWLEKSRSVFTDKEIFELTMQNRMMPEDQQANLEVEDATPGCWCHAGNSGYSCKKLKVNIFPPSLSWEYGICELSRPECRSSTSGCGALWLQSCTGNHCNF